MVICCYSFLENKNIVDTNTDVNKKQESPRKNDGTLCYQ